MSNLNNARRILVVNRSLDVLNLFHDILDEQGYDVELSNFSFESLSTIEKLRPNIIILDFGREGNEEEWQLLKMLKLYPPVATTPILLCISPMFLIYEQVERFRQKNIRVLFTPIDKEELVTVVHEMLSSH